MSNSDPKIVLAKWSDRFFAWLIDFVIISVISTGIIFGLFGNVDYEFEENNFWINSVLLGPCMAISPIFLE